jgi:putative hydroxymethylpyrimidine transport system ATP-binding protein
MLSYFLMSQNLTPAVTVSKLHIRYKHHWLFDQFDFCLPANQWTCLLGPSGIGKTSLLRFIAGLQYEEHTECSGHITASDGQPLNGRLIYMTQQDSLLPWLNILDNVLLGFYLRNEKITIPLKQRANLLLTEVGLKHVNKMKPEQLSCGMRQRVVLVRSLIEDRKVVLMDEPFSALDTITRFKLQDLAASLLINRTVLLVTHDPLEALRLGHQVYIISGSPAKISHMVSSRKTVPCDVSDENLLKAQAELIKVLAI